MDEAGLIKALKALADKKRIRMAREIACAGELSCTQVKAHFHLSQPTISHHLKILKDAGVITVREAGQHRFISVNSELINEIATVLPISVHQKAGRKRNAHEPDARRREEPRRLPRPAAHARARARRP